MIPADVANTLNGFFDKIFVVSIPRFTERHARVKKSLEGLQFEIFWGQDKELINQEEIIRSGDYAPERTQSYSRRKRNLMPGEIACSMSHRKLYDHIIRQRFSRVLVLEDDVVPLENNLIHLGSAIEELPGDWGLVYFGYLKHEEVTPKLRRKQFFYKILSTLGIFRWSTNMVKKLLPKPYSSHLSLAGFHDCTHAYAITAEAAAVLLQEQRPLVHRADDLLSYCVLT